MIDTFGGDGSFLEREILSSLTHRDRARATQAMRELEFLLGSHRRHLSLDGTYQDGKQTNREIARAIQEAIVMYGSDGDVGKWAPAIALMSLVKTSARALPRERFRQLHTALKERVIAGARSRKRGIEIWRTQFEDLPVDVLSHIVRQCDMRARSMAACTSRALRDAVSRTPVHWKDAKRLELSTFPRVRCAVCREYMWNDDPRYTTCFEGRNHEWFTSERTWMRDLEKRMSLSDTAASDSSSDEDGLGTRFWRPPKID